MLELVALVAKVVFYGLTYEFTLAVSHFLPGRYS